MREEIILKSILLWFFINYIFLYFKSKREGELIEVSNAISLIFGAPVGIGIMPKYSLLLNFANLTSLILGLLFYYLFDKTIGGNVYIFSWIILVIIVAIYDEIN
jgi:hypothetical protein